MSTPIRQSTCKRNANERLSAVCDQRCRNGKNCESWPIACCSGVATVTNVGELCQNRGVPDIPTVKVAQSGLSGSISRWFVRNACGLACGLIIDTQLEPRSFFLFFFFFFFFEAYNKERVRVSRAVSLPQLLSLFLFSSLFPLRAVKRKKKRERVTEGQFIRSAIDCFDFCRDDATRRHVDNAPFTSFHFVCLKLTNEHFLRDLFRGCENAINNFIS